MLKLLLTRTILATLFMLLASFPAISHQQQITVKTDSHVVVAQKQSRKEFHKFMTGYIEKNNESLRKIKKQSTSSFRMMDKVFAKYGLPKQLKYLAVIESEMKTTAVSRVGAAGPWQLMPETAQILGLKVTSKYDERTNMNMSTRAAAVYLRDLHTEFNDWLLVLAAYNAGPGPVYKAIKKSGSRNFWDLQDYLPRETRMHVKKFIATHYYFEGLAFGENSIAGI
jgi:membrane-bound lytic murein transglycosylase D